MKKIILVLVCTFLTLGINAQKLTGAWERYHTSDKGENLKSVVVFSDEYQVISTYNAKNGEFVSTNGGTWKLTGVTMTEKIEFDSNNSERIGKKVIFDVFINDSILGIVGSKIRFKRIDNGEPRKLQGVWVLSKTLINGEAQLMDKNNPIKTIKILSGKRFQWIAYNTETKQLLGTKGGIYLTTKSDYTEILEFISKDYSKIGDSLKFNCRLIDDQWFNTELSKKEGSINEIWNLKDNFD